MEPKRNTGSSHHTHHLPPFASATWIVLRVFHLEITAFWILLGMTYQPPLWNGTLLQSSMYASRRCLYFLKMNTHAFHVFWCYFIPLLLAFHTFLKWNICLTCSWFECSRWILPVSVKHDHQFSTYMIFRKFFLGCYFLNTTS